MPLVSVVIPAFNAERTIDRTLASVRAQTHADIEIIVINDGSTDATASRVHRHADEDPRVRLVEQGNEGVAGARNRGLAESRGEFIAPVDADDLWHPDKIALQVAVLEESPNVGLVATAYSVIDAQDRVIARVGGTPPEQCRFEDLCRRNFIGNGSSALMRRALVERFGGYDPGLRARGGQGCEDLQLYLQIAEVAPLAFIPEPLTAYRRGPANMSGDAGQMLRSFDLVAESFCLRRPELRGCFNEHRVYLLSWLLGGALRSGNMRQASALGGRLLTSSSRALPKALLQAAGRTATKGTRRLLGRAEQRPPLPWA